MQPSAPHPAPHRVDRIGSLRPLVQVRHQLELLTLHLQHANQAPDGAAQRTARQLHADTWAQARAWAEESRSSLLRPLVEAELPVAEPVETTASLRTLLAELRAIHDILDATGMGESTAQPSNRDLPATRGATHDPNGPAAPTSDALGTPQAAPRSNAPPPQRAALPPLHDLMVELGTSLVTLADEDSSVRLTDLIQRIRSTTFETWGVHLGAVHIRDNLQLASEAYRIVLRGEEQASDRLYCGLLMAIGTDGEMDPSLRGLSGVEPSFGLPIRWIPASRAAEAEALGYPVVSPVVALGTHLQEVIQQSLPALFGYPQLDASLSPLLDRIPLLRDALSQSELPLSTLLSVFRRLLEDGVPVRDAEAIVETCIAHAQAPTEAMVAACRARLGATVVRMLQGTDGVLRVLLLAPELEAELRSTGTAWPKLADDPSDMDHSALLASIDHHCATWPHGALQEPVLLVSSPVLRAHLSRLVRNTGRNLPVLSLPEIPDRATVEPVGAPVDLPSPSASVSPSDAPSTGPS